MLENAANFGWHGSVRPFLGEPLRWVRVSKKRPCPVCGNDSFCEVSDDGRLAHCMKQEAGGRRIASRLGGFIHVLRAESAVTIADLRPVPQVSTSGKLDPATLDALNRALLEMCPLSVEHRSYLVGEGVPVEGCGTFKLAAAGRMARALVAKFGENIAEKHPALRKVQAGERSWWTIAASADGLLFPAVNVDGLILGIQLRKDKPRGDGDRYRWLSSEGKGGTPLSVFKAEARHPYGLIITEGYKKAAAARATWGCGAISLAGVSAYNAEELISTALKLGAGAITLAFDRDKRVKPQVREAEQRLLRTLGAALPEVRLQLLNWTAADGAEPKGLDDALKAEVFFYAEEAAPDSGPRLVKDLPGEIQTRVFGGPKPLYTVNEARRRHREVADEVILSEAYRGPVIITSPTGTGKSRAADDALAEALLSERLARRVLLLAPNKANIAERTAPGTKLGEAVAKGLAVVQRGRRLIDLTRPYTQEPENCANADAIKAGAARQVAAKVVCAECVWGSAAKWEENFPGLARSFECERVGYLNSRKRSDAAQAVIATKEAFLNGSDKLKGFDAIICDEDLLPYLYEAVRVGTDELRGWREKIALRQLAADDWQKLFEIIERALDLLSTANLPEQAGRLFPANIALRQAAQALGYDLEAIVTNCANEIPDEDNTYNFEKPYRHNARLVLPFRAAASLLRALQDEANPPQASRNIDGSFSLELFEVRAHLVEILRDKRLLVLDATVPPALKLLFPNLQELNLPVPQNLEIVQVTNGLYSKQDLYRVETRRTLSEAINRFAKGSRKHLSIVPMRFEGGEDGLELPSGSQSEHWGLHKATSRFADCDSLALVGHHLRPVDRIRAEVVAIRAWCAGKVLAESDTVMATPPNLRRLRLYNYVSAEGKAAGRWMKADRDREVQAAIEHDYVSHIIQAIGRLRAALRPAKLGPARVLILCNEPVGDLQIDQLVSLNQLNEGTNPALQPVSIHELYMKSPSWVGLVARLLSPDNGWDEGLIQDETAESQSFEETEDRNKELEIDLSEDFE